MNDSDSRALGSDPFNQGDGTLPYLLRLRERTVRLVRDQPEEEVFRLGSPLPHLPLRGEGI